jgi:RNA polymerase sigma factor (sigma-70 family)
MSEVTQILAAIDAGDPTAAEQLLPLVYDELRKLAAAKLAHEKPGQTLQATALVHEAYLRLVRKDEGRRMKDKEVIHPSSFIPHPSTVPAFDSRGHFFAAAAEAMRRIMIDRARQKQSTKGGGLLQRVPLDDVPGSADRSPLDLIALDDALLQLETSHPRQAQLIKLRFFAGLTNAQAADVLGIAATTADNDWAYAKTWLKLRMDG